MIFDRLSTIKDAKHFIKILLWAGLVSAIIILSLAGVGLNFVFSSHIMNTAESNALSIGKAIVPESLLGRLEQQHLNKKPLHLSAKEINFLDQEFYTFLKPFDVFKIKVFSLDHTIIYSSDHTLINLIDADNNALKNAFLGHSTSFQKHSGQVADLDNELRFDIDTVETYLPIYNKNDIVIGSFEIYLDTSRIKTSILQAVIHSLWVLLSIILLVFLIAFWLIRHFLLELQTVQERLQQLATKDSLTNLSNHKEIARLCSEEFDKYKRQLSASLATESSIIMLDLDHFKNINDQYGHQVGDEVLIALAKILLSPLRSYELVGRYGGEEFIILLPSTSFKNALTIAERLRVKVTSLKFKQDIQVTASFGVSTFSQEDDGVNQVIKRADDAMYQAKKLGRNRVESIQ